MERSSVEKGIGCAAVLPAAMIGFAGLTDGIGPKGWPGISELLGWATICLLASWAVARLLSRVGRTGGGRFGAMLAVIVIVVGLTALVNWLGLGAPMEVKILYTSGMQVVGNLGAIGFAAAIVYFALGQQRRG